MLFLLIVLILGDSVTLLRQCSYICDGASIINPCFQMLMTALGGKSLFGLKFLISVLTSEVKFLFYNLAESSVSVIM